jgi:hypothetical protein
MEGLLKTFGALTKDAPNDWEYFPAKIQSRAGGGRTHTVSPPADFKSTASANSATAPNMFLRGCFRRFALYIGCVRQDKMIFF